MKLKSLFRWALRRPETERAAARQGARPTAIYRRISPRARNAGSWPRSRSKPGWPTEIGSKLDENLGERGRKILLSAGHDVASVASQKLERTEDRDLIDHCRREARALVTLDLDFANPLLYQPREYSGIAVQRLPRRPSAADLLQLVRTLVDGLTRESLPGLLWIVEQGRIRVYQEPTE